MRFHRSILRATGSTAQDADGVQDGEATVGYGERSPQTAKALCSSDPRDLQYAWKGGGPASHP